MSGIWRIILAGVLMYATIIVSIWLLWPDIWSYIEDEEESEE